jgi:hypothetical protein
MATAIPRVLSVPFVKGTRLGVGCGSQNYLLPTPNPYPLRFLSKSGEAKWVLKGNPQRVTSLEPLLTSLTSDLRYCGSYSLEAERSGYLPPSTYFSLSKGKGQVRG